MTQTKLTISSQSLIRVRADFCRETDYFGGDE